MSNISNTGAGFRNVVLPEQVVAKLQGAVCPKLPETTPGKPPVLTSVATCLDRGGRWIKPDGEMHQRYAEYMSRLESARKSPTSWAAYTSGERGGKRRVKITIELAFLLLCTVLYNRVIDEEKVIRYALAMRNGEWESESAVPISFDQAGHLVDGNHRLLAVILSGVTIIANVEYGLTERAIALLDPKSAARSIEASSGYVFHPPLKREVTAAIKMILQAFNVNDWRIVEGLHCSVLRFAKAFESDINRLWKILPGASQSRPSYRKGELLAALLTCVIVNRSMRDLADMFRAGVLDERQSSVMRWFQHYFDGTVMKDCRQTTDFEWRYKAFLSALLTMKQPTSGANGLGPKHEDFVQAFIGKVWKQAGVELRLEDKDRQPTAWNHRRDFRRDSR